MYNTLEISITRNAKDDAVEIKNPECTDIDVSKLPDVCVVTF